MVTRTPRERQREATRRTILDAAGEALLEGGFESFSMRKLAGEVGYAPGTIYLYFRDKEEILDCLIDEAFSTLLETLEQVHDEDDDVRSLENKLRAYVDFGLRHPSHYRFAFVMRRTGKRATGTIKPSPAFDVLRDAVRRCVNSGSFPSPDVETTSQVLWTAIHGLTSLLIVLPNFPWVERERLIDRTIGNAIDGCRFDDERSER